MNTVAFRDFEERDVDFIYRCKNNDKLNEKIVGEYHHFSYDEAVKWVYGCMGDHETYKFWAVCTNDDEQRIIGWVSLSEIDKCNSSACFHGIVIADSDYRDGFAWIESYLFVYEYVFERLGLNRLYGCALVEHANTQFIRKLMFCTIEGVKRQAVYKNGRFHDVSIASILKSEYFEHKNRGDYEMSMILKRVKEFRKNKN